MAKKRSGRQIDETSSNGQAAQACRSPTQLIRDVFNLTPREAEVAHLLSWSHTNAEIARKLGCTPNTVKAHVGHLFMKVEVCNRRVLARRIRMALSSPEDQEEHAATP